jgi:hypothetical protein
VDSTVCGTRKRRMHTLFASLKETASGLTQVQKDKGVGQWQMDNASDYRSEDSRKIKATCFLSYVEDRSKDKHVHKNKHDHTQIYIRTCL